MKVDAADKPVGVLTDRDIACRPVAEGRDVREEHQVRSRQTPAGRRPLSV